MALLGTAGVLGLVACGSDAPPTSQPHIGGERFIDVRFEDVPFPPDSTVLLQSTGERTLQQTVNLEVPGESPQAVMAFYGPVLEEDGWEVQQEPQDLSNGGQLAVWARLGRTLVISAVPGEVTEDDPNPPVEVELDFTRLRRPGSKLPDEEVISSVTAPV